MYEKDNKLQNVKLFPEYKNILTFKYHSIKCTF